MLNPLHNNRMKLTRGEGGSHRRLGCGARSIVSRRAQLIRVLYVPSEERARVRFSELAASAATPLAVTTALAARAKLRATPASPPPAALRDIEAADVRGATVILTRHGAALCSSAFVEHGDAYRWLA
jgi:hypothetical protein